MRIETITREVVTFSELDKVQKINVLDNLRGFNVDYGWWEYAQEDFHTILEILGYYNINSSFSGFSSQGDGACFKATFTVPSKSDKIKDRLKKLKDFAPFYFRKNKSTLLNLLELDYQLSGYHNDIDIDQCGRDYHEYTMSCDNSNLLEVSRQLASKYYNDLYNEYSHLTSDEVIEESIESNELEFYLDNLNIC